MNKKKLAIGTAALAALAISIGAFASSAQAYRGDYTQEGPNYTQERHEQMESAFENNDYNAWKELMNGRGRVTQVVNEGNFNRFAEAHRLADQGDHDGADQIRQELNLRTRNGEPTGQGYGGGQNGQGQGQGRNNR
jgi:Spy/CpxP family protein refolding chaperone